MTAKCTILPTARKPLDKISISIRQWKRLGELFVKKSVYRLTADWKNVRRQPLLLKGENELDDNFFIPSVSFYPTNFSTTRTDGKTHRHPGRPCVPPLYFSVTLASCTRFLYVPGFAEDERHVFNVRHVYPGLLVNDVPPQFFHRALEFPAVYHGPV